MEDEPEPDLSGHDILLGRRRLGMSAQTLWVGYFAVGGNGSLVDVERWLSGALELGAADYDMLTQALNDVSVERGEDHPFPYSD